MNKPFGAKIFTVYIFVLCIRWFVFSLYLNWDRSRNVYMSWSNTIFHSSYNWLSISAFSFSVWIKSLFYFISFLHRIDLRILVSWAYQSNKEGNQVHECNINIDLHRFVVNFHLEWNSQISTYSYYHVIFRIENTSFER